MEKGNDKHKSHGYKGGRPVHPTEKQIKAMEIHLKNREEGKTPPWKEVMLEAGFAESSTNNPGTMLLNTGGWKQMLAEVDEKPLLDRMREIALESKNENASLKAIKELLLLKERYPKESKSVKGAWKEREGIIFGDD